MLVFRVCPYSFQQNKIVKTKTDKFAEVLQAKKADESFVRNAFGLTTAVAAIPFFAFFHGFRNSKIGATVIILIKLNHYSQSSINVEVW